MKKIVLILVFFISMGEIVAQNFGGMNIFHGSFDEAKTKAKDENKLIFIDFYTQWCGPCFNMVKTVFVVPEVGNFYNNKFICIKIDAESEEGKIIAGQYKVKSYPTYVFMNPENGLTVHRSGGRKSVEEFLQLGKAAFDPKLSSVYLLAEYEKGNRDQDFMISYIAYKASIYDRDAVPKAFAEIIKNGGKLTDPKIWALYNNCISGYDNPYLKEVSDNYSSFVKLFGKESVDAKLAKETSYCSEDFMAELCDFKGKALNSRLKKISDLIFRTKDYANAIVAIDALIADETLDKQKVIDRLKFMIRLNKRYDPEYPDAWFYKCIEYLRYVAYNNAKRDDERIHFEYALGLEMLIERIAKDGSEIPEFLKTVPEYGKKEYSTRPAELKMKPKYRKK